MSRSDPTRHRVFAQSANQIKGKVHAAFLFLDFPLKKRKPRMRDCELWVIQNIGLSQSENSDLHFTSRTCKYVKIGLIELFILVVSQ